MGKKDRRRKGISLVQEDSYSVSPVFSNYRPKSGVEFAGYSTFYVGMDRPMFSISAGWCMSPKGYLYYSYAQAFKYRLRKLLRLPVESDDPRDLVTWRLLRRR